MKRLGILFAALLVMAQSPTPMHPLPKSPYDSNAAPPTVRYQSPAAPAWQRFQGAKVCQQVDRTLTCDNGLVVRQ